MKRMTVNLFFIQFILSLWCVFFVSAPYQNRIRAVLAPYILRSKVLLHEESTERVRSRYGFDTSQMLLEVFKTWCLYSLYIFTTRRCVYQRRITGHAVIVVDVAIYPQTGKKVFLLTQSYMPAQQIQILVNPANRGLSPWYELSDNDEGKLYTPEWVFEKKDLKRFK